MPANIPNMGAIQHVASAEAHKANAFQIGDKIHKQVLTNKAAKARAAASQQNRQRNEYAASVKQAVQQSQAQQRTQAQQQRAQQGAAKKAAAAHTAGVKKGTAAPMPGAAPRTFAMPSGPQGQASQAHAAASAQAAKTMQQQRNSAHGQAIQMQNQMNRQAAQAQQQHARTMQSQVNTAHGQALRMQGQMDAANAKAVAKNKVTQAQTPATKQAPTKSVKGGILTHLSETETNKTGRPNSFSAASQKQPRAKTNVAGLGAMGANLEAGLTSKKFPLPEPRKRV